MTRPYDQERDNDAHEYLAMRLNTDLERIWSGDNTQPQNDVGVKAYIRNLCRTHVLVQDTREAA